MEVDIRKMLNEAMKKKEAFQTMQESLADKQRRLEAEKQREKDEDEKYQKYMQGVQKREYEFKMAKAELEATKAGIYERMKDDQIKRQKETELMENLREELYREELEEKARQRDQAEREKLARQKEMMRRAEIEDHAARARRKEEERLLEEKFKIDMMRKFAEEAKLEQLNLQKRRMKELEHKREVRNPNSRWRDYGWRNLICIERKRKKREKK